MREYTDEDYERALQVNRRNLFWMVIFPSLLVIGFCIAFVVGLLILAAIMAP